MNLSDESFEPTLVTREDYRPGFARGTLLNGSQFRVESPLSQSVSYNPSVEEDGAGTPSPQVSPSSEPSGSMQEFYQLFQELLLGTLALTLIIFIGVWIFYSLNIALNYLIGACTGVVYLRMLARDVERLGREKRELSKTRLALLIGLILLASQWNQLKILPIFLGFLTYKAALIIYVLRTAFSSDSQKVGQS